MRTAIGCLLICMAAVSFAEPGRAMTSLGGKSEVQATASTAALSVAMPATSRLARAGDVVTLVAAASCGPEVATAGRVEFFDGNYLLGTRYVIGPAPAPGFQTGTSVLKVPVGAGHHVLKARFGGSGVHCGVSESASVALDVADGAATRTTLAAVPYGDATGAWGLSASVVGKSWQPLVGEIAFRDKSTGDEIRRVALGAAETAFVLHEVSALKVGVPGSEHGSIATLDMNSDGIIDVAVASGSSVWVMLRRSDGGFNKPVEYSLAASVARILIFDANLDGIPDLVTAKADGTITVFLGNGDGTLSQGISVAVAESASGMEEGDFNGDGRPDVAVFSKRSPDIFVLLGNGNGTFQNARVYFSGEVVTGIALMDFDRDGNLDVIASGKTGLYALRGRGDGSLSISDKRSYEVDSNSPLSHFSSPVVGDFDGDGISDIAMLSVEQPFKLIVVFGNGDGSFGTPRVVEATDLPNATITDVELAAEDINRDGRMEIVQLLSGTSGGQPFSRVYLYAGLGDEDVSAPRALQLKQRDSEAISQFSLADLNGDGLKDLVAVRTSSEGTTIVSALIVSECRAALTGVGVSEPGHDIQAEYLPANETTYLGSISNAVSVGGLIETTTSLEYGYKSVQGSCFLAGDSYQMYWNSVPCFYVHVAGTSTPAAISGTVTLHGTTPAGVKFDSGPYTLYPDANGGGYIYVFYNYGLGDAGDYSFSVSYQGDATYVGSVAGPITLTLHSLPTKASLQGPERLLAGNSAVLTGNIESPIFPSILLGGPVSLWDGDALLQKTYAWTNTYAFVVPEGAGGTRNYSVRYEGLPGQYGVLNAASSQSNAVQVRVFDRAPTAAAKVRLSPMPAVGAAGVPIALSATVTADSGVPLEGEVTFLDGAMALGTAPINTKNGVARIVRSLTVGEHVIAARYDGIASITAVATRVVLPATSESNDISVIGTALSSSDIQAAPAKRVHLFEVTGTVFGFGTVAPEGSVVFEDLTNGSVLGSAVLKSESAQVAFGPSKQMKIPGRADFAAIDDFNDDGFPDLATCDIAAKALHVSLNTAAGEVVGYWDYVLDDVPVAIGSTDVNRDGHPDLLVPTTAKQLQVLFGTGDARFDAEIETALPFAVGKMRAGDLNGDGKTDLIIAGQVGSRDLAVLIGNGDGSFTSVLRYTIPPLGEGYSVDIADLNGDGVQDVLVVTNSYGTYELLGVGDGSLQPPIYLNEMGGAEFLADLNGDGAPDLVFATADGNISVQLGKGDGSFLPSDNYSVPGVAQLKATTPSIAVHDFNRDGVQDILVRGGILFGKADGTFAAPVALDTVDFGFLTDVNGDGVVDLVAVGDGNTTVRYGGITVPAKLENVAVRGTGSHQLQARFVPTANASYASSTSEPISVSAYPGSPSEVQIWQESPLGAARYGEAVTLHGYVAPLDDNVRPTGSLEFDIDSEQLQSVELSPGGVALLKLETLPPGTHTIRGTYRGDELVDGSSGVITVSVERGLPDLGVSCSAPTVTVGGTLVFTVTVHGRGAVQPSGTVEVWDGDSKIASVPLARGVGIFETHELSRGLHSLSAHYSGDDNYADAVSTSIAEQVLAPDFELSVGPVMMGGEQSGTATLTVTGIDAYSGDIALYCLPSAEANCTFEPKVLHAGAKPTTASVIIELANRNAGGTPGGKAGYVLAQFASWWILVVGMLLVGMPHREAISSRARILSVLLTAVALVALCSCAGRNAGVRETSGRSSLTVVASAGALSHSVEVIVPRTRR